MPIRFKPVLIGFLLTPMLMVVILRSGSAQPGVSYPRFQVVDYPEYRQALKLEESNFSRAVVALKELAARNPRTTLGAVSLFRAASDSARTDAKITLYNSIIAGYPGSRFEIFARASLINIQTATFPRNRVGRLQGHDQMLQSFGGPSLASILSGGREASRKAKTLSGEIQQGLDGIYDEMGGTLAFLNRVDDALSVAFFQRDNFLFNESASDRIGYLLVVKKFGRWTGFDAPPGRKNPEVRFLQPKHGQTKGPRPLIRWETTVGDWRYPQVDIAKMTVLLDGQNVRSLVSLRSKVNSSLSTKSGAVFERLRCKFRPLHPLAVGTHTLTLTVPTQGYSGAGPGIANVSLDFTVSRNKDDGDDEDRDDEENHLCSDD